MREPALLVNIYIKIHNFILNQLNIKHNKATWNTRLSNVIHVVFNCMAEFTFERYLFITQIFTCIICLSVNS